jgi:hypothetical protein
MKRQPIGRLGARDWQLYTDMAGVGAAARALTKFLREELKGVRAGDRAGGQEAYNRWYWRVQNEGLAKWGAMDSEPLAQATVEIERVLGLRPYSIHR